MQVGLPPHVIIISTQCWSPAPLQRGADTAWCSTCMPPGPNKNVVSGLCEKEPPTLKQIIGASSNFFVCSTSPSVPGFHCGTVTDRPKPIWPSGPANDCCALGRRFESGCRPSNVWWSFVVQMVKGWDLPLICRFDPGTHLTVESERTLDLPRRRSRQGTSPWLSTE